MLREIKNDLYCITFYNGNKKLVECERGEELIVYVAEMECKEVPVSSVIKICADGSRPIVDVKSNPYYKITYERILEKISETKRNRKEEFEEWNRKYGDR